MKKNSKAYFNNSDDLQEPHDLYDDLNVDGDFFIRITTTKNVRRNDLDDFFGMCDPPDVESNDIPEANYQNLCASKEYSQ